MIIFRRFLWFVVGVLLSSVAVVAHADFPAIAPNTPQPHPLAHLPAVPVAITQAAICGLTPDVAYHNPSNTSQFNIVGRPSVPFSGLFDPSSNIEFGSCGDGLTFARTANHLCPSGGSYVHPGQCSINAYTCPNNSTMSGSGSTATCSCNSGYIESGSSCIVAPDCPVAGALARGHIAKNQNPGVVCFSNCEATIIEATNQAAVGGVQVIAGTWAYTGVNTCTGQPAATEGNPQTGLCPANTCPGEVNGDFTCLPCSSSAVDESWKKLVKEETNADGSTTNTESTTKTTCNGSTCTTETTTTKTDTPSGGGSSTTENTGVKTEQTQDDYCAANPNSPKCKNEDAGNAVSISGLYDPESLTFGGAYDSFAASVASAPVVSSASGFFSLSLGASSCPTWTWDAGDYGVYSIDIFCNPDFSFLWETIAAVIMIGAVIAAIFIALF